MYIGLSALFSVLRASPALSSPSLVSLALPAAFVPAVVSLLCPGLYVSYKHFSVDSHTASRSNKNRLGHTGCLVLEPKSIDLRVRRMILFVNCTRSENNKVVSLIRHVEGLGKRLGFAILVPTEVYLAD